MVRIIPFNLRSQETVKDVPHAHARAAAWAGRGMALAGGGRGVVFVLI
jgi:hypothetical protein